MSQPYALQSAEGAVFQYAIPHLIKAGERGLGRGLAVFELDTCAGEEPPLHTHQTEDEAFYILEGEAEFQCNGQMFSLAKGGFIFLPCGLPHTYVIPPGVRARFLIFTWPNREFPEGWGGYVGDVETLGERQK